VSEKTRRLHVSVIHPLISVTLPCLFVLTLHSLVRGSLGVPDRFPDVLVVLGPVASLIEAVAGNAARRQRAALHWRVRELTLYLLVVFALFVAVSAPLIHYAYLAVLIAISWAASYAIHDALRSREELLRCTEGRSGQELSRAMHDALILEGDALAKVAGVRRVVAFLQGSMLLVASLVVLAGGRLSPVASALLVAQAVARHLTVAQLNAYAGEQRLLGLNLRLDAAARGRRLLQALLVLGAALVGSLVLARRSPPLSAGSAVEAIGRLGAAISARRPLLGPRALAFLRGLLALLARLFPGGSMGPPLGLFTPSLPEGGEPSELVKRLLFAAGMTIVVLAVALVVAFLFVPLTEAEFTQGLSRKRPLTFLRHRFRLFGRLARGLAHSLRGALTDLLSGVRRAAGSARPRAVSAAVQRASGGIARPGSGAAEVVARRRLRSVRQRAIRAFRALAAWCARKGMTYRPGLGPLEFAREAGRRFPERARALESSAELLERILYCARPAGRAELSALTRAVRSATRGP